MQEYETLKQLVAEVADDVSKAVGGNKAAGTRVRDPKMMPMMPTSGPQQKREKMPRTREAVALPLLVGVA